MKTIKYQSIWGRLYILLGILFSLLFIIGSFILGDLLVLTNLAASILILVIGKNILKNPYVTYTNKEITVYGLLGNKRKQYIIKKSDTIKTQNQSIYLNDKKLKLNHWFIDKGDWKRFLSSFTVDNFMDELLD